MSIFCYDVSNLQLCDGTSDFPELSLYCVNFVECNCALSLTYQRGRLAKIAHFVFVASIILVINIITILIIIIMFTITIITLAQL